MFEKFNSDSWFDSMDNFSEVHKHEDSSEKDASLLQTTQMIANVLFHSETSTKCSLMNVSQFRERETGETLNTTKDLCDRLQDQNIYGSLCRFIVHCDESHRK